MEIELEKKQHCANDRYIVNNWIWQCSQIQIHRMRRESNSDCQALHHETNWMDQIDFDSWHRLPSTTTPFQNLQLTVKRIEPQWQLPRCCMSGPAESSLLFFLPLLVLPSRPYAARWYESPSWTLRTSAARRSTSCICRSFGSPWR